VTSAAVNDAGQDALGNWQYKFTVFLRETGGVNTTVTNLHVQARLGSDFLASASAIPMVSVFANSSGEAGLIFAANTHVTSLATLTVDMTVQFTDANGNTGAISSSGSCFGCWDY
jgi:hypothetical protein